MLPLLLPPPAPTCVIAHPHTEASARAALLHARNPAPEVLPYYLADVEDQWRRTVLKRGVVGAGGAADASLPASEGVFDSCIMLAEPLPPYEAPPEAARLRAEQEEEEAAAAAAQAQALAFGLPSSRGTAGGMLSSMSTMASVRAAPPTPAGPQRAGTIAAPWSGPGTPGLGATRSGPQPAMSRHGSATGALPGAGLSGVGVGAGSQEGNGSGAGAGAGSGAAGAGAGAGQGTGAAAAAGGGAGPSRFAGGSRAGSRPPPVAVPPHQEAST